MGTSLGSDELVDDAVSSLLGCLVRVVVVVSAAVAVDESIKASTMLDTASTVAAETG